MLGPLAVLVLLKEMIYISQRGQGVILLVLYAVTFSCLMPVVDFLSVVDCSRTTHQRCSVEDLSDD